MFGLYIQTSCRYSARTLHGAGGCMGDSSRTPVIIGVAQSVERGAETPEPMDAMASTATAALADAHARGNLAERVDAIGVVQLYSWDYDDPAALLARRLGSSPRHTMVSR